MKTVLPFFLFSQTCLLPCLSIGDFAEMRNLSLEEIVGIYSNVVSENYIQIQESGANGVVSNVFPVYMAGYIHSERAIPLLLDRLEWPGANEPTRYYYVPPMVSQSNDMPIIRLGMGSTCPQPPTPAVGALTQMPVSWETLEEALTSANPTSRRAELLAWVSAVKYPTEFSTWLSESHQAEPDLWGSLTTYASTNLVGRKPFSMDFYQNCPGFSYRSAKNHYDQCVSELRHRVAEEEKGTGTGALDSLLSALHLMGQPAHPLTPEETQNSVEHIPEVVSIVEIQDSD